MGPYFCLTSTKIIGNFKGVKVDGHGCAHPSKISTQIFFLCLEPM
jgi:hypothetical protein